MNGTINGNTLKQSADDFPLKAGMCMCINNLSKEEAPYAQLINEESPIVACCYECWRRCKIGGNGALKISIAWGLPRISVF